MLTSERTYVRSEATPEGVLISLLSHILKLDLIEELQAVLSEAHANRIVITGSNGYFAAGADITELGLLSGPEAMEYAKQGQSLMRLIERHPATIIAAIDGYCFGGGLDLALACDLRYATKESIFAHPGGRIGIMTGWGGTRRLPLMIGKSRALEMMAIGRRLSAVEAYDWGLINGIVENPVGYAFRGN
ncbi:MAG: enoyl-CoA hydratase/isomerase family protein [Acidobacteria bacterium]|nr:enoyl-CoA hydratase/isomerase family protein [Acidobacteriota bacterium]